MPLILNGTTGVSGVDGTAATPAAQGTDTNTGVFYGTDTVSISTGGTARVVVNSSGQTVLGAGTAALPAVTTTGDTNTGVFFPAADTVAFAEGGVESARFDASGNLLVGVTSANANGGVLQLKSGITFPATQVTSTDVNTLDDYEEGDWTPRIDGNTTAGTGTYTNQKGTYVKIGSLVMAKGYVTWSAHTGTGFMRVAGLPFSSSSTANTFSTGTIYMDAPTTITAGAVLQIYLAIRSASAITSFYTSGGASVATTTMSNSGGFMVNLAYTI